MQATYEIRTLMSLESEDHEMLVKEFRGMDREELKATIDYWEDEAVWSHQLQMLDMVKHEIKMMGIHQYHPRLEPKHPGFRRYNILLVLCNREFYH